MILIQTFSPVATCTCYPFRIFQTQSLSHSKSHIYIPLVAFSSKDFPPAQLEDWGQIFCRFSLLHFLVIGVQRAELYPVMCGRQCDKTHWRHVEIFCLHPSLSKILLIHSSAQLLFPHQTYKIHTSRASFHLFPFCSHSYLHYDVCRTFPSRFCFTLSPITK